MRPFRLRFGLLPRLLISLLLVGVLPLSLASIQLIRLNREAMTTQVLRSHSIAARATAERLTAMLRSPLSTMHRLAGSRILMESPKSQSSQEMLAGALSTDASIRGLVLLNGEGLEVVRVQRRGSGPLIDQMLGIPGDDQPRILEFDEHPWLLLEMPLEKGDGELRLLADAASLAELLEPEDLGEDARIGLLSWEGLLLSPSGSGLSLDDFPPSLVRAALAGKIGGAGRYPGPHGEVLGAFSPVGLSSWVVVSLQPVEVAEAIARRMRRRAFLTLALVGVLVFLLAWAAYRQVIRPLRRLNEAQQDIVGITPGAAGNEVESLVESFNILQQRLRDREDLGEVFLGRFLVVDVIGQGAMGTVFRGWDPKLERPVALKTIRGLRDDGRGPENSMVSGLLREAVMAAGFSHPNIVSVYDVEDTPEAAFVAMELIEGPSLSEWLRKIGRMPQEQAVHVGLAIAGALEAAHSRKIIHQDIKPGNVLLGYDGAIKVVDFGISRSLSAALDSSEMLFGTPGYLPPEALKGEGFDTRGDLFALGVLLYLTISGLHPFLGSTLAETYVRTVEEPIRDLGELRPDLDGEFRRLVMSLIERERDHRPESASVVVESLQQIRSQMGLNWDPPQREDLNLKGVSHDEVFSQVIPTTRIRGGSSERRSAR